MEEVRWQLSEKIQHVSDLLQKVTEEAKGSGLPFNLSQLLNTYVYLIRDQFDYYCVGLSLMEDVNEINDTIRRLREEGQTYLNFLGEDEQWFRLRAITDEAGQPYLEGAFRRKVGGGDRGSRELQQRQAFIYLDVGEDAVRFQDPYFPDTRSEIILPLINQEQLVGVLDIQSTKETAFFNEDIPLLQTLADQLAAVIQDICTFCEH